MAKNKKLVGVGMKWNLILRRIVTTKDILCADKTSRVKAGEMAMYFYSQFFFKRKFFAFVLMLWDVCACVSFWRKDEDDYVFCTQWNNTRRSAAGWAPTCSSGGRIIYHSFALSFHPPISAFCIIIIGKKKAWRQFIHTQSLHIYLSGLKLKLFTTSFPFSPLSRRNIVIASSSSYSSPIVCSLVWCGSKITRKFHSVSCKSCQMSTSSLFLLPIVISLFCLVYVLHRLFAYQAGISFWEVVEFKILTQKEREREQTHLVCRFQLINSVKMDPFLDVMSFFFNKNLYTFWAIFYYA